VRQEIRQLKQYWTLSSCFSSLKNAPILISLTWDPAEHFEHRHDASLVSGAYPGHDIEAEA
jgi:hypothetical protein